MHSDLVGRLRAAASRAFAPYSIRFAYLFGSHAAGRADEDVLAGVKYRFVVAIEACIDAGRHLVASGGLRAPRDYADVFTVLGEAGILSADVVAELRDTARFRNLLVHEYVDVDDARVVEMLHSRLDDLQRFRRALATTADRDSE